MIKISMFLFLVLVFPGLLVFQCVVRHTGKEYAVPVIWGFFAGCIVCVFHAFFIFSEKSFVFSYWRQYLRVLLHIEFFPLAVTGLIVFFVLNDSVAERLKALFPFWAAFYAVYIPYDVLAGATNFSLFELFAKPLLYAALLVLLKSFIPVLFSEILVEKPQRNMQKIAVYASFILGSLLFPPAVETCWFIGLPWMLWFIGFAAYVSAAVYVYKKTENI